MGFGRRRSFGGRAVCSEHDGDLPALADGSSWRHKGARGLSVERNASTAVATVPDARRDADRRGSGEIRRGSRGSVPARLGLHAGTGTTDYSGDTVEGSRLPQAVLEKFYWKNAERLVGVR